MAPEQNYPSPTAAQVSSGAAPFFGQNNDAGPPQIPNNLQQLQSVDMQHQSIHSGEDPMTGNAHGYPEHQHVLDESLRVDEALRQPTSPERLAQSVMSMSNDQSPFQHQQPLGPEGSTPKTKRTKVSRACDECRRKKIRCDASDTSDDPCTSCKRTGAPCRFSRQPMKRGPSKGYIKELADRLNTLESQLGPQAQQQHGDAYPPGLGSLADLGEMQDFDSPTMNQSGLEQQSPAQMSRKRTHSVSENAWARDQPGYAPARAAASAWAESAKFLQNPYTSGGMQPQPPQGLQGDAKQVPNMGRSVSFRQSLDDSRRPDLGLPFDSEARETESGAQVEWDDSVIDEYYRLVHQTFPILPHSKARLRVKLANCPATLREAFLVALDCAVRTSPSTHLQPAMDSRGNTRRASELLAASQYENVTTRNLLTSLVYIQTLVLMALESDNHGPATMRVQVGPPRAEWLGRAIGVATHLKLNVANVNGKYAVGDPDADEKVGRRLWWILFILDRWQASSTSCALQMPETSAILLPEDSTLLGESTYHLARLSFILGHLSTVLQQPGSLMSPPSPAAPIISTIIQGELARFRESVEPILLATSNSQPHTNLLSLAYWHVRLLIFRTLPATTPQELLLPASRMASLLDSPLTPITPLNHHFAALAALTLVELCAFDDTRAQAEQGLKEIEDAANRGRGLMARDGSSGWESAIRELVAKGVRNALPEVNAGSETATAGLQHLADAAIGGKGLIGAEGEADVEGAASAAAAAAAAAAVSGEPGAGVDASVFDPTLLTRYGYLAALAQE